MDEEQTESFNAPYFSFMTTSRTNVVGRARVENKKKTVHAERQLLFLFASPFRLRASLPSALGARSDKFKVCIVPAFVVLLFLFLPWSLRIVDAKQPEKAKI